MLAMIVERGGVRQNHIALRLMQRLTTIDTSPIIVGAIGRRSS